MKYYLKQAIFSIGDRFAVYDANQNLCYYAQGAIFTLGAKLRLYDAWDNEQAYVERELFRFMPRYNIHLHGGKQLHIRKEFALFRNDFAIEDEDGDSLQVEGSIFGYDFRLLDRGVLRMECRKKLLSWGDSYEIIIPDPNDVSAMLAVMLAIDNAIHDEDNQ